MRLLKPASASLATPLSTWTNESLIAEFFDTCLPSPETPCSLSWIRDILPQTNNEDDSVFLALLSVATGWIGRFKKRDDLMQKALQMYTVGVSRFRHQVSKYQPCDALTITTLYIIFELFQFGSENNDAWKYHLAGASGALKAAGTKALPFDPFIHVYLFCRSIFVRIILPVPFLHSLLTKQMIQSLRTQGHVSLEGLEWKGPLPSSDKLGPNVEYWQLIDIGVETANLLGSSENTSARLYDQLKNLYEWKVSTKVGTSNDGALAVVTTQGKRTISSSLKVTTKSINGPLAFPGKKTNISQWTLYESINNLKLILNYWAIRLTILTALLNLRIEHPGTSEDWIGVDEIMKEAEFTTAEILKQKDTCCKSNWPSFGHVLEIWAIETALQWYSTKSKYLGGHDDNCPNDYAKIKPFQDLLDEIKLRAG